MKDWGYLPEPSEQEIMDGAGHAANYEASYSDRVKCQSCANGIGPNGCTDCLNTGHDPAAFAGGFDEALNDAYAEGRKDEHEAAAVMLRDRFAMHAMFGLLAQPNFHPIHNASYCYEVADAMLEARKS